MIKYGKYINCSTFLKFLSLLFLIHIPISHADEKYDWRDDWSLKENFDLSIDTEGYRFPAAIAFVPNPGKGPKDPLYFVTELRGKIKVVTNDRTVYTFAQDFFRLKPDEELPTFSGENGLAGICLEPEHGYVFVTFAYQDQNKVLHNNIVRFDTKPGTFSVKPSSVTAFTDIFKNEGSSPSHQIGSCQIYDNMLYAGVGDGFDLRFSNEHNYIRSQDINYLLGKILRMTLDGKPVKSNPYYVDDDVTKARNYVWAIGLRNPFGLKIVDGRVFVADNGPSIDRFIEVHQGVNYLWDGTDESISSNANLVLVPGAGVTELAYFPEDLTLFPKEYRGRFYLNQSGDPDSDPQDSAGRDIRTIEYNFEQNRLVSPPDTFLKYRGKNFQTLVGLAVGPDGLYFVPILPFADGRSVVFKVTYNPESKYPHTLTKETNGPILLEQHGCYGCHIRNENGWGTAGPRLDRDQLISRVSERLSSQNYIDSVKKLDKLDTEPYKSYRAARQEVLSKTGTDQIKTWMKYHIMEPKFDNPKAQMPNLGIKENEAVIITNFLVDKKVDYQKMEWDFLGWLIPHIKYRYLAYSFLLGFAFSLLLVGSYTYIRRKK
jgi:Glucose / Sorbosone dehydrogenase